jgi:hypothetical protein
MVRSAIDRPQKLCLPSDVIQLLQIIRGSLDERIVLQRDRLCMDVGERLQKRRDTTARCDCTKVLQTFKNPCELCKDLCNNHSLMGL